MAQGTYIRFLVATKADPTLRAAMKRVSRDLRTPADLVAFAEEHGYRFAEEDIPLEAAQSAA